MQKERNYLEDQGKRPVFEIGFEVLRNIVLVDLPLLLFFCKGSDFSSNYQIYTFFFVVIGPVEPHRVA